MWVATVLLHPPVGPVRTGLTSHSNRKKLFYLPKPDAFLPGSRPRFSNFRVSAAKKQLSELRSRKPETENFSIEKDDGEGSDVGWLPAFPHVLVASMSNFLFGYHIGVMNGPIVSVARELGFEGNSILEGLVVSIFIVGAFLGSVCSGSVVDKLGCRRTFQIDTIPLILGALISSAQAHSLDEILWGRFLVGLGIGVNTVLVPIYISEIAPTKFRGSLGSLCQIGTCLGIIASLFLGFPSESDPHWWRTLLYIASIPGFFLILGMQFAVDSPRWLCKVGRTDDAKEIVRNLWGASEVERAIDEFQAVIKNDGSDVDSSWLELLEEPHSRVAFIGGSLFVLQQFAGINGVLYFSSLTFQDVGITSSALASLLVGVTNFAGAIFASYLIDKEGRQKLLIGSYSGMVAMWNAGPSNYATQNNDGGDSDDEFELAAAATVLWYYYTYMERPLPQPKHTSILTGTMRVQYLLDGHEDVIRSKIRMGSDCFRRLSSLLELKGLLRPTRNMNVDEQLFIFLYIVCQSSNNRESQDQWQHSGATISKYFHAVLKALYEIRFDMFTPPNYNIIDPVIAAHGNKYLPWFQNCVGALDGTHVPVVPPAANAEAWRNRKGFYSQNVLGVCSFDMRFTYILAGWEGSAHDARVLTSATETRRKHFPTPPEGKYYLVDSGYANNLCYLAPYRGSTYHLQEFRARRGRPQTPCELFNYTHSSLRNCIERTFGVWKARFRILKCITNYPIETQRDIPLACAILHNFIHMYNYNDDLLTAYMRDAIPVVEIDPLNTDQEVNQNHNPDRGTQLAQNRPHRRQMHILRDEIANSMWAAYENNRR